MISQGAFTPDIIYCRDIVAKHDYERLALCMSAPKDKRIAMLVLCAFYYEIAKTRDVAGGMAGHLRLTWWQDAIKAGDTTHEVLRAIKNLDMPQDILLNIIEARRADMEDAPPQDLSAHEKAKILPLLKGFAHILGEADADLEHLATAYGLTGHLRALSYNIGHGRKVLPHVMMDRLGVHAAQISHLKPSDDLRALCADIAQTAGAHLAACPEYGAKPFRRLVCMLDLYLGRMRHCGYDAFAYKFFSPVPFLGIRLWLRG